MEDGVGLLGGASPPLRWRPTDQTHGWFDGTQRGPGRLPSDHEMITILKRLRKSTEITKRGCRWGMAHKIPMLQDRDLSSPRPPVKPAPASELDEMVDAGNKEVVLPEADGCDIDSMPDGILGHILGFLPAEEAVRTSALAPSLEICHRPVDRIRLGEIQADDVWRANFWVRHAIQCCKTRTLKVKISSDYYSLLLDNLPLVSRHLTKLELHCVVLRNSSLDFTSCPALEVLQLNGCGLWKAKKIVSNSLKHLEIIWCCINDAYPDPSRVHICAPKLQSLHIDDIMDIAPMLDRMPLLVKAFIRLTEWCADVCAKLDDPDCTDCLCEVCDSSGNADRGGTSCVLLNGLSEAKSLVLISTYPSLIIFKGDLRRCPVFNNLKTLLLNDYWCVPDNFHALTCILEHSPVLEKLTLQLFSEGPKHNVELIGGFSVMGPLAATISEHLNTVEIKCEVVDEKVLKVLEFLSSTYNICFSFC
ncbi:hypothetical protein EJB05_36924, partial [Eragrostis curvula]